MKIDEVYNEITWIELNLNAMFFKVGIAYEEKDSSAFLRVYKDIS